MFSLTVKKSVIPAQAGIQPLSRVCGDKTLFSPHSVRKGLDSGLRRNDDGV